MYSLNLGGKGLKVQFTKTSESDASFDHSFCEGVDHSFFE